MTSGKAFDHGRPIDWGKTSADYAKYRPGPPSSLYQRLLSFGIGAPGQRILDQGTGTGVLARQFARQGCDVTGTDISAEQIATASELARHEGLQIHFHVAPAEAQPFESRTFDVVTASQCHMYFDLTRWVPETRRLLRPDGQVVLTFFSWLPLEDPISRLSEELVLRHNPDWEAHSWDGKVQQVLDWSLSDFHQTALIVYDEPIRFTRDAWRGRWRALRGIGATLSPDQVAVFDQEHDALLQAKFGDEFAVRHRVVARILEQKSG